MNLDKEEKEIIALGEKMSEPTHYRIRIHTEERTLEDELHDIVHDLAIGSGIVCPSCGKTL